MRDPKKPKVDPMNDLFAIAMVAAIAVSALAVVSSVAIRALSQ